MKKIFLIIIAIATIAFSQDVTRWINTGILWNSGGAASDTLITTGADTSDWFRIPAGISTQVRYPETLSFLLWGDMGAAADSTKGTFTLQLSNDSGATKTYIYAYGTLAALPIGTADPKVEDKIVTDLPLFEFGRIIITAALESGDSSMFGATLTRDFSNY